MLTYAENPYLWWPSFLWTQYLLVGPWIVAYFAPATLEDKDYTGLAGLDDGIKWFSPPAAGAPTWLPLLDSYFFAIVIISGALLAYALIASWLLPPSGEIPQ